MSRKPKPVDPWPVRPPSDKGRGSQQPGLSQDTVDAIYEHVLNGGTTARTTTGQFQKGTSGNPRGRPKRSETSPVTLPPPMTADSLGAIAMRQGGRKIKAHTEQGEVELSLTEAVVTKMVREAVKGNTGHARTFLQIIGRAESEEAKRKREEFRYWAALKEQAVQLYQQAELAGEVPPLSVHPDDIVLSSDGTVEIVGPTTAEDIAAMRYTHSLVDYHIVNMAYNRWVERRMIRKRGRRVDGLLYAELDFWAQQNELPPRLRMTTEEVIERLQSYAKFSGRDLHLFLRQKAAPHGCYVPPREARIALIVPKTVLEFGKANKLGLRRLLSIWLDAESTMMQQRHDQLSAKRRHKELDPSVGS